MKSVLLLFFFFFFPLVSLWTQRKQDAKVQSVGLLKSAEHLLPSVAVAPEFHLEFI